jgi:hypothetical protein
LRIAFLQVDDGRERQLLASEETTMRALLKPKGEMTIEVLGEAPPASAGCLSETIGSGLVAHLAVKVRRARARGPVGR